MEPVKSGLSQATQIAWDSPLFIGQESCRGLKYMLETYFETQMSNVPSGDKWVVSDRKPAAQHYLCL